MRAASTCAIIIFHLILLLSATVVVILARLLFANTQLLLLLLHLRRRLLLLLLLALLSLAVCRVAPPLFVVPFRRPVLFAVVLVFASAPLGVVACTATPRTTEAVLRVCIAVLSPSSATVFVTSTLLIIIALGPAATAIVVIVIVLVGTVLVAATAGLRGVLATVFPISSSASTSTLFRLLLFVFSTRLVGTVGQSGLLRLAGTGVAETHAQTTRTELWHGAASFEVDADAAAVDFATVGVLVRSGEVALVLELDEGVAARLVQLVADDAHLLDGAVDVELLLQLLLRGLVRQTRHDYRLVRVALDVLVVEGVPLLQLFLVFQTVQLALLVLPHILFV